jgi:hypothetical protein
MVTKANGINESKTKLKPKQNQSNKWETKVKDIKRKRQVGNESKWHQTKATERVTKANGIKRKQQKGKGKQMASNEGNKKGIRK